METNVNAPWMNFYAGSAELVVKGTESRAETPWGDWKHRAMPGKTCTWRKQNTRVGGSTYAGTDHSGKAAAAPPPLCNRRQNMWPKFIFTCSPGTVGGPSNTRQRSRVHDTS